MSSKRSQIRNTTIYTQDIEANPNVFLTINKKMNNNDVIIKVKKLHPDAVMPVRMHIGDAGFDLTAVAKHYDRANRCVIFDTGLAFEIPEGYVMLLFARSSGHQHEALMANCVDVIDSSYRGQVHAIFKGLDVDYEVGDRVVQAVIMPIPSVKYIEVDSLSESDRGCNGLGSTGVRKVV